MGVCKFCGQKAGFLSSAHRECQEKYDEGRSQIIQKIADFIILGGEINFLDNNIKELASKAFIEKDSLGELFSYGFDTAIARLTTDGVISEDAENKINVFFKYWGQFTGRDITLGDSGYKMHKSIILREVMHGEVPSKLDGLKQGLPFNFVKDEKLVWAEKDIIYCEQKTRTHYQGGSSGISMRIAKGLYYRTSSFRGYPVQTAAMVSYGTGTIAITDKYIYYSSPSKTFRIKIDKIVAFHPYSDAIGFEKDSASAKPQLFKNIDGTFYYNLLSNLANLDSK